MVLICFVLHQDWTASCRTGLPAGPLHQQEPCGNSRTVNKQFGDSNSYFFGGPNVSRSSCDSSSYYCPFNSTSCELFCGPWFYSRVPPSNMNAAYTVYVISTAGSSSTQRAVPAQGQRTLRFIANSPLERLAGTAAVLQESTALWRVFIRIAEGLIFSAWWWFFR